MVRMLLCLSAISLLVSCQKSSDRINTLLQSSVDVNAESTTHLDWETSEYHPQQIFKDLRKSLVDNQTNAEQVAALKKQICSGLQSLSDDSLLIFESEISNQSNKELLGQCYSNLSQRLQSKNHENMMHIKYFTDATSTAGSNIDFQLKTKIIRDFDHMNLNKHTASLKEKEVLLTFDDGPHNEFTHSVLRTLEEAGSVKAMFYQLGKQISQFPQVTAEVSEKGHIVANHSWNHYCMDSTEICKKNNKGLVLTDQQVQDEVVNTFNLIKSIVGKIAPFFRFPYGDNRNATSEFLKKYQIFEMHWNIDSNDWRYMQKIGKESVPFTSKDVLNSALGTLDRSQKGVVLFHDVHRRTAEILPQFLYELYKRDYTIVLFDKHLDPDESF